MAREVFGKHASPVIGPFDSRGLFLDFSTKIERGKQQETGNIENKSRIGSEGVKPVIPDILLDGQRKGEIKLETVVMPGLAR